MAFKIVITEAKPILSWKQKQAGFGYYVKHWDVAGYTWDGDCMCSRTDFKEVAECGKLEVSELELKALIFDKVKKPL